MTFGLWQAFSFDELYDCIKRLILENKPLNRL